MPNSIYAIDSSSYKTKREEILKNKPYNRFIDKSALIAFKEAAPDVAAYGTLPELEGKLNSMMDTIRNDYFTNTYISGMPYPPALPFYKAKPMIDDCLLFKKVFKKMPKGGLLHIHNAAALTADKLIQLMIDWTRKNHTADYQAKLNKSQADLTAKWIAFRDSPTEENRTAYQAQLTTYYGEQAEINKDMIFVTLAECGVSKYPKGSLLFGNHVYSQAENATRSDSKQIPNNVKLITYLEESPQARNWLKNLLMLGSDRLGSEEHIWDEFGTIFARTEKLLENENFFVEYHKQAFIEMIEDNIHYVELRCSSPAIYNDGLTAITKTDQTIGNIYKARQQAIAECSSHAPGNTIYVKLILCANRSLSPSIESEKKKLANKLKSAVSLQASYAGTQEYDANSTDPLKVKAGRIIGFDFVSEEDRGRSSLEYTDLIYSVGNPDQKLETMNFKAINFKEGEVRYQPIDYYLHDGESNWYNNLNMVDASIISQHRVGHGFNILGIPGLLQEILYQKDNSVPGSKKLVETQGYNGPLLEICPISNQLLLYFPDLRNHSARMLMNLGIQCVIANDDPQIFDNPGLSYDFWEAYMAFGLDLYSVKALVYNAANFWYQNSEFLDKNPNAETRDNAFYKGFNASWFYFVTSALQGLTDSYNRFNLYQKPIASQEQQSL